MNIQTTDVVVVGAGPVGLLLAGDLAVRGVDVVVVDRLTEPMTETRASLLNARTMELLVARGLRDQFAHAHRESTGHFGGVPLRLDTPGTRYPGSWKLPQFKTEAILTGRATSAGADLRRGHELLDMAVNPHGVVAVFDTPAGRREIHARHVVGCDGAASTVRELGGFTVTTTAPTVRMLRADVRDAGIPDRRLGRTEHGVVAAARRPDGVSRLMVHVFADRASDGDRAAVVGIGDVAERWVHVTGESLGEGAEVLHGEWFDDADSLVDEYRRGRLLLAGDAAHDHLPSGGQAVNLGLQDAAELGWKLAAHVQGWAPPALLDSYGFERRAVARQVLRSVRAQATLLFGDQRVLAMRAMLGELLAVPECAQWIAEQLSGLDPARPAADGTLPSGAQMPDLDLVVDGAMTTPSALGDGAGLLLDLSGDPLRSARPAEVALPWSGRVRAAYATPREADAWPFAETIVLVRPDGRIAWSATTDAGADSALRRWFGNPLDAEARPGPARHPHYERPIALSRRNP